MRLVPLVIAALISLTLGILIHRQFGSAPAPLRTFKEGTNNTAGNPTTNKLQKPPFPSALGQQQQRSREPSAGTRPNHRHDDDGHHSEEEGGSAKRKPIQRLGVDSEVGRHVMGFGGQQPSNKTHTYIYSDLHPEQSQQDIVEYKWTTKGKQMTFFLDRTALRNALAPVRLLSVVVGGCVVVTFGNLRYADVMLNWLIAINKINVTNFIIVSLDKETAVWLQERGIATFTISLTDFDALWFVRMLVFRNIAELGITFIASDTDAIWMKDPQPIFFNNNNNKNHTGSTPFSFVGHHHDHDHHDDGSTTTAGGSSINSTRSTNIHTWPSLMFSQGTTSPPHICRRWGFVVCNGFFYARSTPLSRSVLAATVIHLLNNKKVPDHATDQDSMNEALYSHDVKWQSIPKKDQYHMKQFGSFTCSRNPVVGVFPPSGPYKGESVVLLQHHLFLRLTMKHPIEPPFVYHLYTHRVPKDKLNKMTNAGLWFIQPNWKSVPFAGDYKKWLSSCTKPGTL
eukprot:TRINITY_DN65621_c8_g4_i1.p1 TRINITY_DN65621_c8_g4~~TRINITY_DN65621_c8_g4_i1.p1  ORF type:complete len:510 (+),score=43.39 TRINITY_DN65621_c8_g4_i1:112-1641(+)